MSDLLTGGTAHPLHRSTQNSRGGNHTGACVTWGYLRILPTTMGKEMLFFSILVTSKGIPSWSRLENTSRRRGPGDCQMLLRHPMRGPFPGPLKKVGASDFSVSVAHLLP